MSSTDTPHGRHRLVADEAMDLGRPAVAYAGPPAVAQTGRRGSPRTASPRRPSLVPRSVTVIAATVGAVFAVSVDQGLSMPAPRPHPDAPGSNLAGQNIAAPALQPVIPAQDDGRPAVPAGVTGHAIAAAHTTGAGLGRPADGAVHAAAAFHAERVVGAVPALATVQP